MPSSNVSLLDASVSLLSVFSESASFAVVSSLSVVSSVAVSVSVFAATGLVPIRVAEIVSADINNVNEANDGKGTLTVKEGKMTIHVSLASKKIVNLFVGKAEDAQKDGAEVLEPTTDTVTYSDGMSEEVYGFDIPVPAIDEEFDVALIGTK